MAWRLDHNGAEVHLEPTVLKLLVYLISNRDRLVSREELMDTVWEDTVISDSALSKAVARLRKALGEDSTAPRYLETVHSKGYRFVAEVIEEEVRKHPDQSTGRSVSRKLHLKRYIAALAVLLLLSAMFFWPSRTSGIQSIAVLPIANLTGSADLDYLSSGLQELLTTELSQLSDLRVTSRQSTLRYKASTLSMPAIARELGVDALVEGSTLQVGENIEVAVQLIDGRTDEHIWAQRYERDTRHIVSLFAEAAASINDAIMSTRRDKPSKQKSTPIDPRASKAYLRGIDHLNHLSQNSLQLAISQLGTAVDIEPDFVQAWGELAVAQAMQALHGYAPPKIAIEAARASALRALEADDHYYIGHATLGWIQLFTRDFPGACKAFQNALRLNPSDPYSLHGDADCMMLTGRMEESIEQVRKAQLVAPFTPMHNRPLPFHLFVMGRYDEAIAEARELQQRIPGYSVHWLLALVYWQQGQLEQAIDEQRRDLEWRKDTALAAALETGLAESGPAGAMQSLAEAMAMRAQTEFVDPFRIGETFVLAGLTGEAFHWLGLAAERGSLEAIYIDVRPDMKPLRSDPRYTTLIAQVGLRTGR